jgi:hypothetical protein
VAGSALSLGIRHRGRFRFAYLVLGALAIAGAVLFGMELQSSPAPSVQTVAWSNWQPVLPGVDGVLDIANHVGAEYHLPDGQQLSRIKAGYPGTAGRLDPSAPAEIRIPVSTIAVAATDSSGQTSYTVIPAYPTTIEYQLCGPAANCGIPSAGAGSSASVQGALHREALELALYTFHYVPDISEVVELLPPVTPNGSGRALLLDRASLAPAIVEPLAVTLRQRAVVASVASSALSYSYQQQFDGTYQMVLSLPN